MGDPRARDRGTIGMGGCEPEATGADIGPEGPLDGLRTTRTGDIDAGQAVVGVTHARETVAAASTGAEGPTYGDQADSPPTHRPVPSIPGYRIEGELGRGGMGVVYRAREVRLDRACALKMILAGAHADEAAAARFLTEAAAIASLHPPTAVNTPRGGGADALPYFELEYVDGGSLDRRLDGTPWHERRAAA